MNENIKIIADKSDIDAIADAVRNKTGSTELMSIHEIASGINGIETGSGGGVNVPEMRTVTFETKNSNVFETGRYPVNISYLTVDENNILCLKTVSGLSGSFSFIPNTLLELWTNEVEIDSEWGVQTVYPNILKINNEPPYVSAGGADFSVCAYSTVMLSDTNHIIIEVGI